MQICQGLYVVTGETGCVGRSSQGGEHLREDVLVDFVADGDRVCEPLTVFSTP
jgi:hypothetical protein